MTATETENWQDVLLIFRSSVCFQLRCSNPFLFSSRAEQQSFSALLGASLQKWYILVSGEYVNLV
jgi:hypothetical protein